jgi:bifunctional non-homologous end joining protein LigD
MATTRTKSKADSKASAKTRAKAPSKGKGTTATATRPKVTVKSAVKPNPAVKARTAATAGKALETYRRKRDFNKTPEPGPVVQSSKGGNSYLIQKHAATRLHYDFRLELDGVLLSWAVPNGPSLDPHDKRLAVRTEDHPLEYGGFEGIIPKGEYGGGTVMLWDRGTWEPIGDPHEGLKNGNLKFILRGERLKGKWVLVRMKPRPGEKPGKENWLLIKEMDEVAQPGKGKALTEAALPSVVSKRSMDEIANQRKRVWSSRQGEMPAGQVDAMRKAEPVRKAPGATSGARPSRAKTTALKSAATPRAVAGALPESVKNAPRESLPDFVPPELCTLVSKAPEGEQWLHEIKLDGYRIQARVANGKTRMLTRKGLDWTNQFGAVARALAALPAKAALIDGEIAVLDETGVSSFNGLQQTLTDEKDEQLVYFAFDLLHLDGRNLRGLPLEERKEALKLLLSGVEGEGPIRYSDHVIGRGNEVYGQACRLALEGMVSKRRDAPYRSGRGRDWVKVKCVKRQEFVVGGWTSSTAAGRDLRSILVGYYDKGKFRYAGKIGTGFNDRTGAALADKLRKLERKSQPFEGQLPSEVRRGAHWAEPKAVVEAEFGAWTGDRILRHAAFKGVREDKDPKEITIELPVDSGPKGSSGSTQQGDGKTDSATAAKKSKNASAAKKPATGASNKPLNYAGMRITHPDKVLWPADGVTKQALADYYASVAKLMLPHIVNRPLSLVRCPDGLAGQCFFQRHVGQGLPDAVKPVKVRSEKQAYLAIEDERGLFAVVQFSALELHPWGATVDDPEHPDRIVMDFDPHESVPWKSVVNAAIECRDRLTGMGLKSFVKTTGGKGLHVVFPLERKHDWDEVRGFAEALAKTMAKDNPLYITTMTKSARTGRIFIDYLRNARTSTAIAPYSTRARPGAAVAAPLFWDELPSIPSGSFFTLANFPRRLATIKSDPWAEMFKIRQSLTQKAKTAVGMK